MINKIKRSIRARQAYKFFIRDWISLGDLESAARVVETMRFSNNLGPLTMDGPKGKNIVVIAPHPDDEMIGPGGTLIQSIEKGKSINVIYLTSGCPAEETEENTVKVSSKFGYTPHFLRQPQAKIPADQEMANLLADSINSCCPDVIFIPFLLDDHDDHRRANEILFKAYQSNRLLKKPEIWAYQVYSAVMPNVAVDITNVVASKATAIRMWKNQMATRDWAHYALGLNAFNSRWLKTHGSKAYAETFFVLPLDEYCELIQFYYRQSDGSQYYFEAYRGTPNKTPL